MSEGSIPQKEVPFVHKIDVLASAFLLEPINENIDNRHVEDFIERACELIYEANAPEDHTSSFGFSSDAVDDIFNAFEDSGAHETYLTAGVTEAILSENPILKGLSELDIRYLMDKALQHEIAFLERKEWASDALQFWYPDDEEFHKTAHPTDMSRQRLEVLRRYQKQLRERVSPTQAPERK